MVIGGTGCIRIGVSMSSESRERDDLLLLLSKMTLGSGGGVFGI